MTKEEKRMELIVKRFQKYVATYSNQLAYKCYSDECFLADMLYGIGYAFNTKKFKFHSGYRVWLKCLEHYFKTSKLTLKQKPNPKK